MAYDSSVDLQQIQSDALTGDTESNLLMPFNSLGFLNKALNTDSKSVVSAINDIQGLTDILFGNFTNFGNKLNGVLLDVESSAGQAKRDEMKLLTGYNTVLEAIVEIAKRGNGSGTSGLIKGFTMDNLTNILTLTLTDDTTYPIDFTAILDTKANKIDLEWGSF